MYSLTQPKSTLTTTTTTHNTLLTITHLTNQTPNHSKSLMDELCEFVNILSITTNPTHTHILYTTPRASKPLNQTIIQILNQYFV